VPGVVVGCILGTAINFLAKVSYLRLVSTPVLDNCVPLTNPEKIRAEEIADSNKLRMPPFRSNMGYNKAVTVNDPIKCQM
jgi:hypothetical protein